MRQSGMNMQGIEVSLQELVALRNAMLPPAPLFKKTQNTPGEKLTPTRGRGIEFDATREYQAGDDIRTMAWRVTARSLKPHIKIYREEKERPVWLALDLSPSLYFGTRCMYKSVKAIMAATSVGWRALQKRERVGAVITGVDKPCVFPPQTNEKYYLMLLNQLVAASQRRPQFDSASNHLQDLLQALQHQVRAGSIIHIFSDFFNFDTATEKLILHLAGRSHVILNFIYDPFESTPPPPYPYVVTNGHMEMLFNMVDPINRADYRELFQNKVKQLKKFSNKHQISLRIHCTDPKREAAI